MVGQYLLAGFSQFLTVVLQASEHPKRVGDGVAAIPGGVGAACGLFFWGAAEKVSLGSGSLRLPPFGRQGGSAKSQN